VVQAPGDDAKKDYEKLQGSWKVIYTETEDTGFKPVNDVRITFDKDSTTEFCAGELWSKSSYAIDPMKKPKTMDITIIENRLIPETKGMKIPCIYDFDKDRLRIRHPNSVFPKVRPKSFSIKDGRGGTLDIYEKVKP
jgi:uncharacterized protein (TIGR03067 family)